MVLSLFAEFFKPFFKTLKIGYLSHRIKICSLFEFHLHTLLNHSGIYGTKGQIECSRHSVNAVCHIADVFGLVKIQTVLIILYIKGIDNKYRVISEPFFRIRNYHFQIIVYESEFFVAFR